MKILLFVLSAISFFAGVGIFSISKSAIHEIEGFILLLIAAIFLTGSSIVESINSLKKSLIEKNK